MAEPAIAPPGRPRRRRPSGVAVYLVAAGTFLFVLAVLAWQLRAGRDPLIGAAASTPRPELIVRRIERGVIVSADPTARASTPRPSAPSAGAVRSAPAPAPAAAPAPVVTRSS